MSQPKRLGGWLAAALSVVSVVSIFLALERLEDIETVEAKALAVLAGAERGRAVARELRQSSDDLTRMARLYTVTGDARYRGYFEQILDIRNGEALRPDPYPGIHWDLIVAEREAPRPAVEAASFAELADAVGFTDRERGLLRLSRERSDELAEIETRALGAETPQQLLEAATELHGPDYHAYKAEIMAPVEELEAAFQARSERERVTLLAEGRAAQRALHRLLLLLLVLSLASAGAALFRR